MAKINPHQGAVLLLRRQHRRYWLFLVGGLAALLLPLYAVNLMMVRSSFDGGATVQRASEWQERTDGVVSLPALDGYHGFKVLRLNAQRRAINTVVFGSSTSMTVSQRIFPAELRVYNFTQLSHPLGPAVAEAEYVQHHFPEVRWFVFSVDWALGFAYQPQPEGEADLSLEAALQSSVSGKSPQAFAGMLREAVSYPRIVNTLAVLRDVAESKDKAAALRARLYQEDGEEYLCPDGTIAKDFDTLNRKLCGGLAVDGSLVIAPDDRLKPGQALPLLVKWADPWRSNYRPLRRAEGVPDAGLLERIARIGAAAKSVGGGAVILLPPLLPGLEAEIARQPLLKDHVETTKRILTSWADRNGLALIDAGRSERFGCTDEEFVDQAHALESCFEKVLAQRLQTLVKGAAPQ